NGNFNPDDYVTREQMAVIMSKLLNLDYNYYQGTNPFSDVPAWAAPYVAACAANGITSGIGGGMYGAGQNVNAVQAALMMLKALGYFQYQQDFGDDYVLATVKQATEVGMFAQIDSKAEQALTRNEVAQMALNALQSDLVRFTGDPGVEYTGSNGESWIGGYKAEYTPRTSTDPKYNRLIDNKHSSDIDHSGQYYCQLGEELYNGNLVKRIDSDIFERPSYTWTYKTEKIGTYMDKTKLEATYTKGVSGRDLYDLLNNITIRDYDLEVYVDGHEADNSTGTTATDYTQYGYVGTDEVITGAEMKRSNTESVGITGDGVLTQVFLDRDNEVITITSIHTWLAQATSTYSETKENATLKVHMKYVPKTGGSLDLVSQTKTAHVEDVPEVEGVVNEVFYRVQMSDKDTSKLEIVALEEPEILAESTITKFSLGTKFSKGQEGNKYPTKITVDGTEYNDSDRACYDVDVLDQYDQNLLTSNTYNVYLDEYGYFLGLDLHEGTKQYVFVTGYDMRNSNLSIQTASAAGIFLDGTMKNITVDVRETNKNIKSMVKDKSHGGADDVLTNAEYANANAYYKQWGTNKSDGVYLLNRWYTYTEANGVYTLKPCVDKNGEAMMLASKTDDVTSGDASELKMNCAKLRLDGVTDSGTSRDGDLLIGETMQYTKGTGTGAGQILTSARAYGEDASVFITVDVDEVSASAGGEGGSKLNITNAITDVNGVYTGVQDVDIVTKTTNRVQGNYYANNTDDGSTIGSKADNDNDAWTANTDVNGHFVAVGAPSTDSYLGENAYAVFDKDHFIIGAVILGEAEGNNATKAYILDPVKYERYENGTYYWQFEAVINGEIVTQEAESKYSSTIDTMRKNQYEIVELRYNAAGDVVTDVKEIVRKADNGDLTVAEDKIYGYPFGEILTTGHKVDDEESIYDVVLTGDSNTANVTFNYVTRPRTNLVEHTSSGKTFKTTQEGTLRLQGRTLYVLDGQHDYGIDFIRDAKAVVRQHEGYIDNAGKAVSDWKTRAYGSVQEAIDSLGDADKATGEKEFKGIITAVLNSNGVAEWVVFYSDTVAETKSDTGIGQATIDVEIRTQLPGGKAEFYEIRKVARPTDGTDVAEIDAPDLSKKGFKAVQDPMYLLWKKYDERPVITFEYVKGGAVTPPAEGNQAVRVEYKATKAGTLIGTETVNVPLDAAGFGTLTADLLKSVPAGYKASNVGTTDSELGNEVMKSSTPVKMLVIVEALPATAITGIAMSDATKTVWTGWGTAVNAAALKNAGITFDVTYANGTRKGVAADDTTTLGTTAIVAGTATDWKADGALKVTVNTDKACTVPVKISATLKTDVVEGDNLSTDWTISAEASKTTKDASVVLTFTHKTTEIDFDEDAAKALVAKLLDDSTGNGIALSFAFKELTTEGVASGTGTAAQAEFTVTATITRTGAPSAADVDLKVKASA
ncbi:MAG: signaling protein, partial [Lawsonibacter sp.]|nr:signaling protein [Lawsonibacter sp.]